MDATAKLADRLGIVRNTIYGGLWDTSPAGRDRPVDTAYTNVQLHPHTDCTYMRDPPGMQCFNCVAQSSEGGETWLVDGFAVASRIRERHPDTFQFLCSTPIPWQCVPETGTSLKTWEPVLRLNQYGQVSQLRFNYDDRGPLRNLSADKVDEWYSCASLLHPLPPIRSDHLQPPTHGGIAIAQRPPATADISALGR
jgi:trimethyllysine dioxygenase